MIIKSPIKMFVVPALAAFFVIAGGMSVSGEQTYSKHALDNGAVLVSKYIPDSPLVMVEIRVMSGLSNEGEYAGSGISHLLEHLLFKATKNKNTQQVFDCIRRMGGLINGNTGLDSAAYHITVPKEKFPEAFNLLSDLVMDLVFSDEDLNKEKNIIVNEMRMHRDDPGGRILDDLFANAYILNVYRYPIIGYEESLRRLTREDVRKYHERNYTPEKMVIGVAGGVPPEQAVETVQKKFSSYKRGMPSLAMEQAEPDQLMPRSIEVGVDTSMGYMAMGFHTTSMFSNDMYALDVLAIVLGEGRASRLDQRLVREKQLLYTVDSSNFTPRYPGIFIVSGIGEPNNIENAQKEVLAVLDEAKRSGITTAEVERAKNIVTTMYAKNNETIGSQTSTMTTSQIFMGEPSFAEKYIQNVSKVTSADVKKVMAEYLTPDNLTVVTLLPKKFIEEKSSRALDRSIVSESVKYAKLPNGMRVIVRKDTVVPMVAVNLIVPGGLMAETPKDNGISGLIATLLTKGTTSRKEEEILPVVESMGGALSVSSGKNSLSVSLEISPDNFDKAMDIFEDVVKNPVFPEDEITREKKETAASIKESSKTPQAEGGYQLQKLLYSGHPYSLRDTGEIETVEKIDRAQLLSYHKKYFLPSGAVMVISGDVDPDKMVEKISSRFSNWEGKSPEIKKFNVPDLSGIVRKDIEMDKEEAFLLVGFRGVDATDKRKYALSFISSMLSGGGGVLFKEIREKHALAYSTGAQTAIFIDPGFFVVYAGTREENVEKVKALVLGILQRISKGKITQEEIDSTKSRMLTSYYVSLQTNAGMARMMATSEFMELGYDDHKKYPEYVKMLTGEDIAKCAGEILRPDRYAEVVVHSQKKKGN